MDFTNDRHCLELISTLVKFYDVIGERDEKQNITRSLAL